MSKESKGVMMGIVAANQPGVGLNAMKPVFFVLRNGLQNLSIAPAIRPACMVVLFAACFATRQAPENQDAGVPQEQDSPGTQNQEAPGAANAADLRSGMDIAGQSGASYGFPVVEAGIDPDGGTIRAMVEKDVRPVCGNGVLEDGERCEGSDLNGSSCQSMGFVGGQLRCNAARCVFDFSLCRRITCGDGLIEGEEQCDGDNLDGMSCIGLGYEKGNLYCDSATCAFDVSQCVYGFCYRGYCG